VPFIEGKLNIDNILEPSDIESSHFETPSRIDGILDRQTTPRMDSSIDKNGSANNSMKVLEKHKYGIVPFDYHPNRSGMFKGVQDSIKEKPKLPDRIKQLE